MLVWFVRYSVFVCCFLFSTTREKAHRWLRGYIRLPYKRANSVSLNLPSLTLTLFTSLHVQYPKTQLQVTLLHVQYLRIKPIAFLYTSYHWPIAGYMARCTVPLQTSHSRFSKLAVASHRLHVIIRYCFANHACAFSFTACIVAAVYPIENDVPL